MTFKQDAKVDLERFWGAILESAKIGPGRPGGLARLALTDEDKEMRDLFVSWCVEAELSVAIDEVGSIFATRPGADPDAAPVYVGSHLDTQINGGRYDGIAGVLAGLEVCRTLNDLGHTTKRPLVVVNWTNEEGGRFSPPMTASGCFVGRHNAEWVYERAASDGTTFGDELRRIGYLGPQKCDQPDVDAYFELHIEQGPILHAEQKQVGVVDFAYPSHGVLAEFSGETAHTGPWPMDKRRNALAAGARWLTAVDDLGWQFAAGDGKATAAQLTAWPNIPGILSDHAQAVCDVRHPDPRTSQTMAERMKRALFEAAARNAVDARILDEWRYGGDIFDAELVSGVARHAERLGYSWRRISSQAGHDAYMMAPFCPTAMIFTPCENGITHNNLENCTIEDFEGGANVLLHSVVERADRK